ncbi:MAG: hypothetical protein AABW49_02865 [Nanoarchaeota archaeon]
MGLVSFVFTKFDAEKKKELQKGMQLKQDIIIKGVKVKKVGKTGEVIEIDFGARVDYSPDIARISIEGAATFVESPEDTKTIKASFDKNKKLPAKWGVNILNIILIRANIKILMLSQDLNLPPHIGMPTIGANHKVSEYIG